jgi:predicted branched-subunit amino acid permease
VGLATGAYGVSFGAVSVAAGLSVAQTCALSLLMFTGASQFALVGVLAAGGAPLSGALTALLLGTRNTLYGLRLAPLLQWSGWRRLLGAHLVIDESTAMSVTRSSRAAARLGFLTTGLSVFLLWNLATFAGAIAGTVLGDPRTFGLDAAVGAAFMALLWPRLRDRRNRLVAAAACYLLKLAGLSVPPRVLERPVVERIADLIPVALLAALVAVQVFGSGPGLVLDARTAGLGVAVVLLLLRAPFLVVVFGAALSAALLRLL